MGDRAQSVEQALANHFVAKKGGSLKGARPAGQWIDEAATFAEADEPLLDTYTARIIACALHARQTDKAGEPYSDHLIGVAQGVKVLGGDDDDVVAAYFHDSVEDHVATYEGLRLFGVSETSIDSIRAVTKIKSETNDVSLRRVLLGGPRAQRLKLADLLHNTRHDRVAALRLIEGDEKVDRRQRTYQRWIKVLMVELGLLPVEVGQ